MAEQPNLNQRSPQAWGNYVVGLLVFLAGVGLMLLAFYWGYHSLGALDAQLGQVQQASVVATPAAPAPAAVKGKPGAPAKPAPEVAQAEPQKGPTLGLVALGAGLRLLTLLVLAGIGAMVAARGALLAGIGTR